MAKTAKKKAATSRAPRKPKTAAAAPAASQTPVTPTPDRVEVSEKEAAQHHILRGIYARFAKAVPVAAASSGAHEPESPIEVKGVPDGQYRVAGADWIMSVKAGLVELFQKAHPGVDPKDITDVPAPQQTHAGG